MLNGKRFRLRPLGMEHHAALCEIGLDERLWRDTTIQVRNAEEMQEYIRTALGSCVAGIGLPFVVEETSSERIVGCTRFHSYNENHRWIEIGFTWLAVPWQRTGANTEMKYLM